ncbi:MAG: hypothetical protein MI753_19360 [Hyphomicrobiales bacterium]|nr:hypothetical protein [Hyphomicrobiales bacterium]
MANKLTWAKANVEISTTAQNSDLNQAGFEGLSYTKINSTGSAGDWSATDNIINYNTLDDDVSQKQKGVKNAGDPQIECAYISDDAGQLAMVAAAAAVDAYAFKLTLSSGDIWYARGIVGGGGLGGGGGREDFVVRQFTIGLVQAAFLAS